MLHKTTIKKHFLLCMLAASVCAIFQTHINAMEYYGEEERETESPYSEIPRGDIPEEEEQQELAEPIYGNIIPPNVVPPKTKTKETYYGNIPPEAQAYQESSSPYGNVEEAKRAGAETFTAEESHTINTLSKQLTPSSPYTFINLTGHPINLKIYTKELEKEQAPSKRASIFAGAKKLMKSSPEKTRAKKAKILMEKKLTYKGKVSLMDIIKPPFYVAIFHAGITPEALLGNFKISSDNPQRFYAIKYVRGKLELIVAEK